MLYKFAGVKVAWRSFSDGTFPESFINKHMSLRTCVYKAF